VIRPGGLTLDAARRLVIAQAIIADGHRRGSQPGCGHQNLATVVSRFVAALVGSNDARFSGRHA
jgi:hypothetical protein